MATISTAMMRRTTSAFGPLQIGITVLVAATAIVHLFLGAGMTMVLMGPAARIASMGGATMIGILAALFFCNFGGYVVLNVALYLPALRRYQHVTRALLTGYAALTFVAYFAIARGSSLDLFGLSDKAVEAVLIALLVVEGRRARS